MNFPPSERYTGNRLITGIEIRLLQEDGTRFNCFNLRHLSLSHDYL